jgi:hypothetical protein
VLELGTARRYSTLPAAGVAVGCCSTVGTDRLLREQHPALGNRPDVPGETQLGEGIQGRLVQTDVAAQPFQFIGREPEALQELQAVGQARCDQEAPVGWELPDEEAEGAAALIPRRK